MDINKTYSVKKENYEVAEHFSETPEVEMVRLKPVSAEPMDFDPGMFVMISGIEKTTQKEMVARAFSIASEPVSAVMEFFVVKEHGGHVSHFMHAQPGDPYIITGPYGQFKFNPEENKKVLFVAGGTGLAPFMSMLRHIKIVKAGNDVVLLYSVKYPTEIIRKEELDAMQSLIGLKLIVSVTRPQPGDGWNGETGHISADTIKKYAPDFMERTGYICGPLAFVKAMKDAFAALGVPQSQVKADVWG